MPNATTPTAQDLEALIAALTEAHERMLALTLEHRGAISRADAAGIGRCIQQQREVAERIAALEVRRRRLAPPVTGADKTTLTAMAERLNEPDRSRVIAAAARLRDVLLRLQHETRTVRAATHALLAHMNGLMQQIARTLSQTRLYGPSGQIESGTPVACGLDLTH